MQSKQYKIINARILTPYRIVDNSELCFSDGQITYLGERSPTSDINSTIIDGQGYYLSPGFIDIHTHGGGGYDFMDNTKEAILGIAKLHSEHGTTSMLPTTLSGKLDETLNFLTLFDKVKDECYYCNLLGVHLEGPYFSKEQKGAQDERYIKPPCSEEYMQILNASKNIMRWSSAVELDNTMQFAKILRERNILPSIAHSNAEYDKVAEAFDNGFTHITHLYSCMSTIVRRNGYRFSGVLESALMIDEMTVELIADGCHIPAELLKLVYKTKGADKIALVTDSMRGAGQEGKESILGSLENGVAVIIEDGVAKLSDRSAFAGSVATTDRLVRTMIQKADVPITDAVRMMTSSPAKIIKSRSKGILAVGYDADLLLFDSDISIQMTIVKGKIVFERC